MSQLDIWVKRVQEKETANKRLRGSGKFDVFEIKEESHMVKEEENRR